MTVTIAWHSKLAQFFSRNENEAKIALLNVLQYLIVLVIYQHVL